MANMINLTINGKNVSVEKGTTIIEAAKKGDTTEIKVEAPKN